MWHLTLQTEQEYIKSSRYLRFNPRELAFYEDIIVLMRNQSVIIRKRGTLDDHEILFPGDFRGKLVHFTRVGNKLYLYRDTGGILVKDRTPPIDWSVKSSVYQTFPYWFHGDGSLPRLFCSFQDSSNRPGKLPARKRCRGETAAIFPRPTPHSWTRTKVHPVP